MKIKKISWVIYWRSPVRLETAPTGSGENLKLPKVKINLHLVCAYLTQTNSENKRYEYLNGIPRATEVSY